MSPCPLCHRPRWPLWATLVISLLLLVADGARTTFTWYAGRWYERSGLAKQWERLSDGVVRRDIERQLKMGKK